MFIFSVESEQFKSLLLNLELIFIFVTTDCHVLFYACVVMMRQC